jgi:hypothetical protein
MWIRSARGRQKSVIARSARKDGSRQGISTQTNDSYNLRE